MNEFTTVRINTEVLEALNKMKRHPRESYNEVVAELIDFVKSLRKERKHEMFLSKLQKAKMKELWDNKEDEVWERV